MPSNMRSPGHITVTLSADEEQIRLTIEDDGSGFQPDSGKPAAWDCTS